MIAYRPEIDGLRAFAVWAVILFHFNMDGIGASVSGGFIGVDVFFVISGYLITSLIRQEQQYGNFSLISFYDRRIRRILPALFVVMMTSMPFAWMWLAPQDLRKFAESIISVNLFISNFYFYENTDYFAPSAEYIPFIHSWNLAIEEQFYVLFPMLLIVLTKIRAQYIAHVMMIIAMASFSLCVVAEETEAFFMPYTRAWELLAGALIATIPSSRIVDTRHSLIRNMMVLTAVGLIIASSILLRPDMHFPGYWALIPVISTCLYILFATPHTWVGRLMSCKAIVQMGRMSYSAYLWHYPLWVFSRIYNIEPLSQYMQFTLLGLTWFLAWVSWYFIEMPYRKATFGKRRIMAWVTLAMMLTASLVAAQTVIKNKGMPERMPSQTKKIFDTIGQDKYQRDCHFFEESYNKLNDACSYHGKFVTWAALGDSHVMSVTHAIAIHLKPLNEAIMQLSFKSGGDAFTDPTSKAGLWLEMAVEKIIADKAIQNIVISYRHSMYIDLRKHVFATRTMGNNNITASARTKLYWNNFAAMVQKLKASGKRVFILYPYPELNHNIRFILMQRTKNISENNNLSIKGVSKSDYVRRNNYVLSQLKTMPWDKRLIPIRIEDIFCDKQSCYAVRNGKAYYFDQNHSNNVSARLVGNRIWKAYKRITAAKPVTITK